MHSIRPIIEAVNKIVSLVDRTTGRSVSFHVTDNLNADTISRIFYTIVDGKSVLNTDEAKFYIRPGIDFSAQYSVNLSAKEYVRADITTNTIEGFFGIFERGVEGIYQDCSSKHLARYLLELREGFRLDIGPPM